MGDNIEHDIVVTATLSDVFNVWANFENFPIFMRRLKSVRKTGENTSHWVMEGPLGTEFEWDAETTEMIANKRIMWRSLSGSSVTTIGRVTFAEVGPNKTRVSVHMAYDLPGGPVIEAAANMLSNPDDAVEESLRRFKEHIEKTDERLHPGDTRAGAEPRNPPDGPTGDLGPLGT